MDLISSVDKAFEDDDGKGTKISDQNRNDINLKKEKLQNELIVIDTELFELEKKYGEFKR